MSKGILQVPFNFIVTVMVLMIVTTSNLFAAPPEVSAARIGVDNNKTRFVLEISGSPAFGFLPWRTQTASLLTLMKLHGTSALVGRVAGGSLITIDMACIHRELHGLFWI